MAKTLIIWSPIPFFFYWSYDLYISEANYFSQTPVLIEFFIFIIFIIYFFYEKMQTVVLYPLYQSITFWISVGLFIYFTGNLFFMIFLKSSDDPVFINQMKNIYSFITISKNIILCLALFGNEFIDSQEENLYIPPDVDLDEFSLTHYKNH